MKHFTSQTGGRFTYVDDFLNLQELALAFGEIFTDCDNFIVSGCEVSGDSISAGLVYLNGKLRIVEETPVITGGWPQYIYEVNENRNVPYASGGDKIGREIWGAKVGKTIPTTITALTNAIPKAIQINANGGLRMKDAWFGKYALLLDPTAKSQSVKGTVNFDSLNASGIIQSNSKFALDVLGNQGNIYFDKTNLVFEGFSTNSKRIQMVFGHATNTIQFIINGKQVASIRDNGTVFATPLTLACINIGNISATGTDIYNAFTSGDEGSININMIGPVGETSYYRTTNIGDGKGHALLSISGKNKSLLANGQLTIATNSDLPLILKAPLAKSNTSLVQYIAWSDVNDINIASFGFINESNTDLSLANEIGNVIIKGVETVDLGPSIKENGILLSEKYANRALMINSLNKKANLDDVYKKHELYTSKQCDNKFTTKLGGLSQFVIGTNTAKVLCSQIGAAQETDLTNFVRKSRYLADMATTDDAKAQIRKNIGAASVNELLPDTKWVNLIGTSLYARQIGNIVCIQGTLTTMHSGVAFQLPNNIAPPKYAVGYDAPMSDGSYWSCKIDGGQKICSVTRCNRHGVLIPISFTYMV